jgi:hypothetical protein
MVALPASPSHAPHEKAPSPEGELGGSLASEAEDVAERNLRQQVGSSDSNGANVGWRGCKSFSVYRLAPTAPWEPVLLHRRRGVP